MLADVRGGDRLGGMLGARDRLDVARVVLNHERHRTDLHKKRDRLGTVQPSRLRQDGSCIDAQRKYVGS